MHGKQPPAEALFKGMESMAHGGLRELHDADSCIAQELPSQAFADVEGLFQELGGNAPGRSTMLHRCMTTMGVMTGQDRHAPVALLSNHADLDFAPVLYGAEQRENGLDGKIGVRRRLARRLYDSPPGKGHRFHRSPQQSAIGLAQ